LVIGKLFSGKIPISGTLLMIRNNKCEEDIMNEKIYDIKSQDPVVELPVKIGDLTTMINPEESTNDKRCRDTFVNVSGKNDSVDDWRKIDGNGHHSDWYDMIKRIRNLIDSNVNTSDITHFCAFSEIQESAKRVEGANKQIFFKEVPKGYDDNNGCVWKDSDGDKTKWFSDCRPASKDWCGWMLDHKTPEEASMKFCPMCGRRIMMELQLQC
jgi:hypothetical protein